MRALVRPYHTTRFTPPSDNVPTYILVSYFFTLPPLYHPATFTDYYRDSPLSNIPQTQLSKANMVAQSAPFQKAITDSKKLQAKPKDEELLQVFPSVSRYCPNTLVRRTLTQPPALRIVQDRHWRRLLQGRKAR